MNKTVLITGANRGIGLALARYYQNANWNVIAVCRCSSQALDQIGARVIDGIDIAIPETINNLQQQLSTLQIDLLINNAGILRDESLGQLNYDSIEQQFSVNTLGPLRVTEALEENIIDGGKIAFITSRMGSIADNTSGGRYGYRMSKCALNAAAMSISHDLKHKRIAVAILHPGLVGTDMIGGHGNVTPDEAAKQLAQRIDQLNIDNSGTFWHADGIVLPW